MEIVSADSGAFEPYVKLGIDPVTTKSDKFMMAFYYHGDSRRALYERCWPRWNIQHLGHRSKVENYETRLYYIHISSEPQYADAMKPQPYNPYSRVISEHTIPECWELSRHQLEDLYRDEHSLTSRSVTIFDADKFINMAPRGIYSFEWDTRKKPIVYAADTSEISGWSDFKPERELAFGQVMIGRTGFFKQRLRIRLSDNSNHVPKKVHDVARQEGSDEGVSIKIKLPVHGTDTFVEILLQTELKDLTCGSNLNWVLGAKSLKFLKISIDNRREENMYQITRYKESSEWSAKNSAAETSHEWHYASPEDSATEESDSYSEDDDSE